MATEVFGNLPPNVVGPLHGFLNVSLQKLKWFESRRCSASTVIQLKWWGEELKPRKFLRPHSKDVRQQKATYAIRCSLKNFEAYVMDIGVLTIYVMSEQGQVFGSAIVDKLPSSNHPVINTTIPVISDTGQQVASMSIFFKLEVTNKKAATPFPNKSSNVQDTVAGLLIKSRELQKSINIILKERNVGILPKTLENLESGDGKHRIIANYFDVEGKFIDCSFDESLLINEAHLNKMLNYPTMPLSPEANPSNENSHRYALEGTSNIAKNPKHEQGKKSFPTVVSGSKSKLNKKVAHKGKTTNSDVPIKLKSPTRLKLNVLTNQPDITNECQSRKYPLSDKTGPLLHCLLSIPKGDGLLHSPVSGCFHTDCNEKIGLYLIVRMLWLNGIFCSDVSSNGNFAFHQVTSVQITHQLLSKFHDNFVSIEVWKKLMPESDKVIGICKLPLHLFYLTFHDAMLTDSVSANSKPVVAVDDMLPVKDLFSGKTIGRLHVFFAMGTEHQIKQLQECTVNSAETNSALMEPSEHYFEVTINHLLLYQPPLSSIWGESDCFVQYVFPAKNDQHPNCSFHLANYALEPCLCQGRIEFKKTIKHTFLSPESSLQKYFIKAFPMQKLPLQVWCRFYSPKEEDKLIAEANIPLSSIFNMIPKNGHKEIFHLNLEPVNMNASSFNSNKTENVGYMEMCIEYKKLGKEISDQPSDILSPTLKELNHHETGDNLENQHLSDDLKPSFSILVKIERAAHLSNIQSKLRISDLPPNCCITVMYTGSSEDVMKTPVICANANPCWNYEGEITLPFDLLIQRHKNLIFHIWHIESESDFTKGRTSQQNDQSELLIGLVFVDLSPLLYGMQQLSGWYNIMDFDGICSGQLKVTIRPQHDIENAKAVILKLPVDDRQKESELLEDLKAYPVLDESLDASRSLLMDNLRNNLTRLDSIQSIMEQKLKNVYHKDAEDTTDVNIPSVDKTKISPIPLKNKCENEEFDIPSTRRRSRVAAAIFYLE